MGSSNLAVKTIDKVIGPEEAKALLFDCRYEYQRPVDKDAVDFYAEQMTADLWEPGTQLKLLRNEETGAVVVGDGQHRLHAVALSGKPQTFAVTEILCKDWQAVARQYYKTDRNKVRAYRDMYRTTNLDLEFGLSPTRIGYVGAAVRFILGDFMRSTRDRKKTRDDILLAQIRVYGHAAESYFGITDGHETSTLYATNGAPCCAVGIVTFRYASTIYGAGKVAEFWDGVMTSDGLRKEDPRRYAREHLLGTRIGNNSSVALSSYLVNAAYRARYLAACWNAWAQDQEGPIRVPRASGRAKWAGDPIKILGTPWKG